MLNNTIRTNNAIINGNNVIYYVTTLYDFLMADSCKARTTVYDQDCNSIDIFTKKGTIRKACDNYAVTNIYSDEYGTRVIIVKKFATKDELKAFGFCCDHDGKMAGNISFSTSPALNPICKARAKVKGSVCEQCFAAAMLAYRKTLGQKLARNTEKVTKELIDVNEIPLIDYRQYFGGRLESFGDVSNAIQAANYINFMKYNPGLVWNEWTKNPEIIDAAMNEYGLAKPANTNYTYSSCFLNQCENPETIKARFPWLDGVFTVYTAEYAIKNNVHINCGAKDCKTCKNNCYLKRDNLKMAIINEIVKDEQPAYYKAMANK